MKPEARVYYGRAEGGPTDPEGEGHHRTSRRTLRRHPVCQHFNSFHLEGYIWWMTTRKKTAIGGARFCGDLAPFRRLVVQIGTNAGRAKSFRACSATSV